ncbi:hypothetical protein [Brevundimonas sp. SL130]|uniref:hypothetical protein n=1 Tax=Brevundimonas sp. SL130 TaxID=2995143 RepID=UPI00226C750A|nr:hypothetical protein [Brevundimonas sp. SL130]WAC61359.1 hypothetical protein OU998_07940 [Brevundimonas sp. SL130]
MEMICDLLAGGWTWLSGPAFGWFTDKLLAPALVAVLFSGLTNIVIERLKAKRDQATKLCDALRADLAVLQQLAADYWSRKLKVGDAVIEAKILSLQSEVIATSGLLRDEFDLPVADDALFADLADALTGGDFGTTARAADTARLKASAALLSELRTRITKERWKRMKKTGW